MGSGYCLLVSVVAASVLWRGAASDARGAPPVAGGERPAGTALREGDGAGSGGERLPAPRPPPSPSTQSEQPASFPPPSWSARPVASSAVPERLQETEAEAEGEEGRCWADDEVYIQQLLLEKYIQLVRRRCMCSNLHTFSTDRALSVFPDRAGMW